MDVGSVMKISVRQLMHYMDELRSDIEVLGSAIRKLRGGDNWRKDMDLDGRISVKVLYTELLGKEMRLEQCLEARVNVESNTFVNFE